MEFTAYNPAEFATAFPRAAGCDHAEMFIAVEHSAKIFRVEVPADMIPSGMKAVQVGYTNRSKTKRVTRFAIVAATEVDQ